MGCFDGCHTPTDNPATIAGDVAIALALPPISIGVTRLGPDDRLYASMSTFQSPGDNWSRRPRQERVALGSIAVLMLPAALQAAFAPRSFFDDFPLGRRWIASPGDTYNEHLVRDVGELLLAVIIATAWTVLRHRAGRGIALAWLVQGVAHVGFHAQHLDGVAGVDQVGLIGSFLIVPVLAVVALWAGRSSPEATE